MILSNKGITKVLNSLRACAGWSVPLMFANPGRLFFSHGGPYNNADHYFFTKEFMLGNHTNWCWEAIRHMKDTTIRNLVCVLILSGSWLIDYKYNLLRNNILWHGVTHNGFHTLLY